MLANLTVPEDNVLKHFIGALDLHLSCIVEAPDAGSTDFSDPGSEQVRCSLSCRFCPISSGSHLYSHSKAQSRKRKADSFIQPALMDPRRNSKDLRESSPLV
jgi:hypothetical protein